MPKKILQEGQSYTEEQDVLYGAVTIGDAWRFGRLDTSKNLISQDIALYRVPDDLEQLTQILIALIKQHYE